MGASNYVEGNASKVFAVDDGLKHRDTRQQVSEALDKLASREDNEYMYYDSDGIEVEGGSSRSYYSKSIGSLYEYVEFKELDESITINVVPKTTQGYYVGFTLDYDIEVENSCDSYDRSYDSADDMVDAILDDPEEFMSNLLDKMYAGVDRYDIEKLESIKEAFMEKLDTDSMRDTLEEKIDKLTDEVEEIFEALSTPLVVTSRASNGEVAYASA